MVYKILLFSVVVLALSCTPKPNGSNIIYKTADEMPRFPGCDENLDATALENCTMEKLFTFIIRNRKYPQQAASEGIEGVVVVRFIVQKDGSIRDAKALNDFGYGLKEEALRVANLMPKWIPGKKDGKPVDVYSEIKVPFHLE